MHAVILGVDHEIQKAKAWRSLEMKAAYRELLTRLIERHAVEFVCEEACSEFETVGQQLSKELKLRFEWKNIDMPKDVRIKAGIDEEQMGRGEPDREEGVIESHFTEDGSLYLDMKDGKTHKFYRRVPSDAVKEDYFFQQAIKGAGHARSVLLVCGNLHFEEMAEKFRAAKHAVTTDALFKPEHGWYRPDPEDIELTDYDLGGILGYC